MGSQAAAWGWRRCKAVVCSTKSFFFLVEFSCSILLVELTVLSFPWRCHLQVVLIGTLRHKRTWQSQSQSQTPMLCSCLGKGARQEFRRSVQVPRLLVPIQKHILSLQGVHLKKQMAKIHWALWRPSCWKCSNVRYDCPTWDNKWDSITTLLLVIFKRYWSPSKCEITQCFIKRVNQYLFQLCRLTHNRLFFTLYSNCTLLSRVLHKHLLNQ